MRILVLALVFTGGLILVTDVLPASEILGLVAVALILAGGALELYDRWNRKDRDSPDLPSGRRRSEESDDDGD